MNHTIGGGIAGYETLVFLILFCVGILFPSATTLAMSDGKEMIGWASAFVGATGFLFGGLVTPLVGMGDIQASTFTALSICSVPAVIIAFATRQKEEPAADSLT